MDFLKNKPELLSTFLTVVSSNFVYCGIVYEHVNILEPGNEINCLDFSMSGEKFVTGGKDLDIRMYDAETNQVNKKFIFVSIYLGCYFSHQSHQITVLG